MHPTLSDPILSQLSEFLEARIGIHFPAGRWNDLGRAIDAASRELGFGSVESCVQWLLSSPVQRRELETLAAHLTVGETYFFREPGTFDAVENAILPDLIHDRRGKDQVLRIWSAGCSTGEEPYSIAILLDKLIPDIDDWTIAILATDINPRFLQKAAQGIYSEWSFRGVPEWIREKCFKVARKGHWQIRSRVKRLVTFSYLNLAEDNYPALTNGTNAMDLIFCRNVLMYFSQARAKQVAENLHRSLVAGGWLIVSPVETSHTLFPSYIPISFRGVTLYRKTQGFGACVPHIEFPLPVSRAEPPLTESEAGRGEPGLSVPQFENIRAPAAAATGPAQPPETVTDPYQEAQALFQQGYYDQSIDKIAATLSGAPDNPHAMELLARALANLGRLAEAAEWCEKAIGSDKLNAGSHYLLATIQQERGQLADAALSLKRALYLDPELVVAHFALGNLARTQGKTRESGKHFENALLLLGVYRPEDPVPESEGVSAGRLMEIIEALSLQQTAA